MDSGARNPAPDRRTQERTGATSEGTALRDIDAAHTSGDTAMEGLDHYMATYDQASTSSTTG